MLAARPLAIGSCLCLLMTIFTGPVAAQNESRNLQRIMERLDANGDGELQLSELPSRMHEAFKMMDSDQSGGLSSAEVNRVLANLRDRTQGRKRRSNDRRPQPDPYKFYGQVESKREIATVAQLEISDPASSDKIQLRINYPAESGLFPVIVFCHGMYGSKDNYLELTEFWASHGYVVVQANHPDSMKLGTRAGDPTATRYWDERPVQVSAILDALKDLNAQGHEFSGKLDLDHVGVGGHSFGANTTLLIAGTKARVGRRETSFVDDRVDAALVMSGQGPGGVFREDSFKSIKKPMMVISGSKDGPTLRGEPAVSRRLPFELAEPGDKYLAWIKDLDHGFGDITGAGRHPYNAEHIAYTQALTLAYWDRYLKNTELAEKFLEGDSIVEKSSGDVEFSRK